MANAPAFQQIPDSLQVPGFYVEFQGIPAVNPADDTAPVLILAPQMATGTASANVPVRVINEQEAQGYLGRGSFGHLMVKAFRLNNSQKELWVAPLADAGGSVKSLWTARLTTVDAGPGTLSLYVGGQLVQVPVAANESAVDTADKTIAQIDAQPDLPIETVGGSTPITQVFTADAGTEIFTTAAAHGLREGTQITVANSGGALPGGLVGATIYYAVPVTSTTFTLEDAAGAQITITTNGTGTQTLTWDTGSGVTFQFRAKNAGTLGNDIDLQLNYLGGTAGQMLPSGVLLTWTQTTPGSGDPSLTSAITAMGDEPYDYILNPWALSTQLDALKTKMDERWRYDRQIYGHVFTVKRETSANLLTFGATRNNAHEDVVGIYDYPTTVFEILGALGGALALTLDADPAMAEQNIVLVGVLPPKTGSLGRFTMDVRQALLTGGIATLSTNRQAVVTERAITTYQRDVMGNRDTTFLDVQTPFTMFRVARFMRRRLVAKFSRKKLADDGNRLPASANVITPSVIKAEIVAIYGALVELGWVENMDYFKANVDVRRNAQNVNRVDILFPPDFVNQLRIMATQFSFKV